MSVSYMPGYGPNIPSPAPDALRPNYTRRRIGAALGSIAAFVALAKGAQVVVPDIIDRFNGIECSGQIIEHVAESGTTLSHLAVKVDPRGILDPEEVEFEIQGLNGIDNPHAISAGRVYTLPAPNSCSQ